MLHQTEQLPGQIVGLQVTENISESTMDMVTKQSMLI